MGRNGFVITILLLGGFLSFGVVVSAEVSVYMLQCILIVGMLIQFTQSASACPHVAGAEFSHLAAW
ncbi:MAG: hypothetical protein ABIK79_07385 [Chloroflexota bacterium]|nr:hypothetical protein [Anaerolineae bacterium]